MFKAFVLVVFALMVTGCSANKETAQKAYHDGCVQGINDLLGAIGQQGDQEKIDSHCKDAAAEYVKAYK
jgi:hypothetical protein